MEVEKQQEKAYLKKTLQIIKRNMESYEGEVNKMQAEIDEMLEHYHDNDVELYTALTNTITMKDNMKRALMRNQKAQKKPYFGRIVFWDETEEKEESLYIGRGGISEDATHQVVIDWRAPVANAYYENGLGRCSYPAPDGGDFPIDLKLKRTYEIENGKLIDYFDTEVIANDDLLTKYLAKNKQAVLGEIIATIQKEQNEIIRKSPYHNMIVQGVAGSGKTTVAMHRISYILYNYQERFKPDDFYIVGSNRILLEYITGVLPDLDVYGIRQMTMEELFVRLLYEDWDDKKYRIRRNAEADFGSNVRGTYAWFHDLEGFCRRLEQEKIPAKTIFLNPKQFVEGLQDGKTGVFDETIGKCVNPKDLITILSADDIEKYILQNPTVSVQNKINMLNERLISKLKDEFLGKGVKYTKEEQKAIIRAYRGRFGRNIWKYSIFDMYHDFLMEQIEKGIMIEIPHREFDVYDLAALAYLYKRVKETEVISEAHHVVIDEAQDFGMMAYAVLKYCIKDCTYTIMGDVSQNIHFGYGLNDWEELRTLMLSGERAHFGILKKSYRNTVEISEFAMNILHHGRFAAYPAEPIIRHGKDVVVQRCDDREELIKETAGICRKWLSSGLDTVAVICRSEKEAKKAAAELSKYVKVAESDLEKAVYENGVMVLPVAYTKGLEFDAVLILNPDRGDYPVDDGHAKLLYVAATRALHELCVLYERDLTGLIADPVPEKKVSFVREKEVVRNQIVEEQKTLSQGVKAQTAVIAKRANPAETKQRGVKPKAVIKTPKQIQPNSQTVLLTGVGGSARSKVNIVRPKSAEEAANEKYGRDYSIYNRKSAKINQCEATAGKTVEKNGQEKNAPRFGDMPVTEQLRLPGHAKADLSVKWTMRQPDGLYLQSRCGVLRISPVTSEIIRITFAVKGQPKEESHERIALQTAERAWMYKDLSAYVEVATDDIILRVDKKSGAITYMDENGKILLSERINECRVISEMSGKVKAWQFFDWKKQNLYCPGIGNQEGLKLSGKAYYISGDREKAELPFLLSDKGYGILIASDAPVICCDISAYGSYFAAEENQIDYYFVTGKGQQKLIQNCERLYGEK
ncbi:MAG: DUF4968 domain-containing protein [Lachnospiraceae bacterium]|nr:DUF4968 domain-containing protein [Lachnospiraceae bacterium]